MQHSTRSPAVTAPVSSSDEFDPHWWVAPLTGTLGAPLLFLLSGTAADLFTGLPVVVAPGLLLPLALAVPSWFLDRRRSRRQGRIVLAGFACGLAATYPVLLESLGFVVFLAALLTGNVHS